MKDPLFLTLAEVIEIHNKQIELYGGDTEIRDLPLLQSALAQPEASFGGQWLHADLHEMAAAYAYHIYQNHPFIDGNKRTSLATALVFLEINNISVLDPKAKLLDATLKLAQGLLTKKDLTKIFKDLTIFSTPERA